ncbi:hypothetical protein LTR84_003946 [Exophiala bonariae]|uniref:Xylanolytic transcriptional activator regulatory domain-containing protein n=1 Tax=Exophiala bonariae TaxID=1690606 RepID=A0AAV9N529_9EURO|nr:hypothetical protein LTR84_003946 [Exophiala bonariae]
MDGGSIQHGTPPSDAPRFQMSEMSPTDTHSTTLRSADAEGNITFQRSTKYITSCSLAFFSEHNLVDLAKRLGHDRVRTLLDEFGDESRIRQASSVNAAVQPENFDVQVVLQMSTPELRAAYIQTFFTEIHPVLPFLDRHAFEHEALGTNLEVKLCSDQVWAMLYCTILSLGMISRDGGSFKPMEGQAWKIFILVLKSFASLLFAKKSLLVAQTLTAMAIFGMNQSSWPVEELLITEAARMAIALRLNKQPPNLADSAEKRRAFWVIYCIEKEYSFHSSQSSLFNDGDISCSVPDAITSPDGDTDWLDVQVKFARVLSHAYAKLFSVSSRSQMPTYYENEIRHTRKELERWKDSFPDHLRPDVPVRARHVAKTHMLYAILQTHFLYYNLQIAMCRLLIHVEGDRRCKAVAESKLLLMKSARMIMEVLSYIPLEPSTPMNIFGLTPIVATFILFDLVVYNPDHSETPKNMLYLDVAAGYLQRLQLALGYTQKGHMLAELTSIARDYVTSREQLALGASAGSDGQAEGVFVAIQAPNFGDYEDNNGGADDRDFTVPDLSMDEMSMDFLHYPTVDSLVGLEGTTGEDLGIRFFGQPVFFDPSNGPSDWNS